MMVLSDRKNTIDEAYMDDEEESQLERFVLPTVPDNCGPQTVSLASLLDQAICHTNREIQITAEILQKKSEMDRKVSILNFANTTRAIYLKLYALVKWVKASKKFDQLTNICYFLDQLSECFVDTADNFVQIAREELIFARLPTFQISQAVDVLSLGTLPRLPESIKTRYIPDAPLTKRQKKLVVKWMTNVINYRLVQESPYIPAAFTDIKVENGVVVFTSPNKFNVFMVLEPVNGNSQDFNGDSEMAKWKWKVVKVEILITNYEIGFGSSLMHPIHNYQLAEFCNVRLKHKIDDIQTVYEILNEFVIKLQLDVIFCQAQLLSETISDHYIAVEVYDANKGLLSILYWLRDEQSSSTPYRITIERDTSSYGDLMLRHHPFNCLLPKFEPYKELPNFNSLFSTTIMFRCRERLYKVKHFLKLLISKSACIHLIGDSAIRLNYSLLQLDDFTSDETLNIAVNTFTGKLQCSIPILTDNPKELAELENLLETNDPFNYEKALECLKRLQILLLLKRYDIAVSNFQFKQIEANQVPITQKLNGLPKDRIYLQFIDEPQYYLILTFNIKQEMNIDLRLFLLDFSPSKVTMTELSINELIRDSAIADLERSKVDIRYEYKTMHSCRSFAGQTKQLQIALATVGDRLLFIRIAEELRKHGIQFEAPVCEPSVGGYIMKLTDVSSVIDKRSVDVLDNFTECCIRWSALSRVWPFECTLKNIPLVGDYKKTTAEIEQQKSGFWTHVEEINPWQQLITTLSDAISAHVVERLKIYTNMITAVTEFSIAYKQYFHQYCNIYLFNYHKLMLFYGEKRDKICIFSWKPWMKGFLVNFAQNTANGENRLVSLENNYWNPHAFVYKLLTDKYNKIDHNLIDLVNYLISTDRTMQCIYYFSSPGLRSLKPYSLLTDNDERNIPIEIKTNIVALSERWIRMCFGVTNIDFQLLSENSCAIQASRLKDMNVQTENNEYIQLPFFKEFWNSLSGGKAIYVKNNLGISGAENRPLSVPQNLIPSPIDPFGPLSCPPQVDVLVNNERMVNDSTIDEGYSLSHMPSIVVDAQTFEKAMWKTEFDKPGPFETYLNGITFLARLGPALECLWRNNPSRLHLPFSNYSFNSRSIRLEIIGIPFVTSNNFAWNISMRIYLCAYTFKVKCELDINGPTVPAESDIKLFESFFEHAVVPLGNEFAVLSFLTICRICSLPVFVAFARLMKAHLESMDHHGDVHPQITGLSNLWCISMQLVANRERVQSGIILIEKTIFIPLNLHSRTSKAGRRETRRIILQYDIENNRITSKSHLMNQSSDIERQNQANIERMIQDVCATSRNECVIWSCIRKILEDFYTLQYR